MRFEIHKYYMKNYWMNLRMQFMEQVFMLLHLKMVLI